jgi:hypothetical protein
MSDIKLNHNNNDDKEKRKQNNVADTTQNTSRGAKVLSLSL